MICHDPSLKRIHVILLIAITASMLLTFSCAGGGNGGNIIPPTTLTSLSVLPATPSAVVGTTVQFRAIGTYSDNSTQDLTNQVAWSSSNTAVATITSTGLAAVAGTETTTITAASGSLSASATLTGISTQPVLTGLLVLPATPSAAVGMTVQFRAIGTYSDNTTQDLSNQVTWSSSNTGVATISSAGLATVAGAGATTISAAYNSLSASTTLTGTITPSPTLKSLSVSSAVQSVMVGTTVQFKAVGTYSDNSAQDFSSQVTWSSSNTAVATINSTGLASVLSAGTTTISVAYNSLSASTTLTGTSTPSPTLTSLAVSSAVQSAVVGTTVQFQAIGTYSDSSTKDLTNQVSWSSSNTAVATISITGLAAVLGAGTTTITAASGSISATAPLTGTIVLTNLLVLPATPTAATGATVQFQAIGTYSDNSTKDLSSQVSWSSTNTGVATINSTGLAAVLSAGTTTISAVSGSLSASATLTGTAPQPLLTSISVVPATPTAATGVTVQFQAIGTYSDNSTQDITNQVSWSSTNTTVATITSMGLAAVGGSGTTTITAVLGSLSANATLTALGSANVLLYATDDISNYYDVIATFNKVRLVSSSANVACDVLSAPVTLNIANLANVMQLIASSSCPALSYNRIDLEFAQSVQLMDSGENASTCLFASYLDYADQPNALTCEATAGTCTLEILGAVRSGAFSLLSTQVNKLAIDFPLNKFTVQNFGASNCSLTMKTLPLHDADISTKAYPEVITGTISNLDTVAHTLTVTIGNASRNVNYTAVAADNANHPGIDVLMQTVQANGIRVMVSSADLASLNTNTVVASDLTIKLEGTVSNYVKSGSDRTFTLTYSAAATPAVTSNVSATKTLTILSSPPKGKKHGNFGNGDWVSVQLYGYDSASGMYLSSLVDVQKTGTKTAN